MVRVKIKKERLKKELEEFRKVFNKHLTSFITGAFTFVAALLWRDAIASLLEKYQQTINPTFLIKNIWIAKFLTAFAVTVIAVFVIFVISKILKQ